jgi:hypothetical protein
MFDAVDSLHDSTRIATGVLSTIIIKPEAMMKVGGGTLCFQPKCQHCIVRNPNVQPVIVAFWVAWLACWLASKIACRPAAYRDAFACM